MSAKAVPSLRSSFTSLLSHVPSRAVLLFTLLQLSLLLLPALSAEPLPHFLTTSLDRPGNLLVIAYAVVGHSCLFVGILTSVSLVSSKTLARWLRAALLVGHYAVLLTAQCYYLKFSVYPVLEGVLLLVTTPAHVIGYTRAGVTAQDVFVVGVTVVFGAVLVSILLRLFERYHGDRHLPIFPVALGLVLIGSFLTIAADPRTKNVAGVARQMSLPVVKYWGGLPDWILGNTIEDVASYLPRSKPPERTIDGVTHVVLIIMESLRADHTPFYGYTRNTMPRLFAKREEWTVFPHYYGAGPVTNVAFATLFGSSYLAGNVSPERGVENACLFWRTLRANGVRTSFIGAGSVKWGSLERTACLEEVDSVFSADHAHPEVRHRFRLEHSDADMSDEAILEPFSREIAHTATDRALHVLYFLGCHYPYAKDSSPFGGSPLDRYDNSIVEFDGRLARVLGTLNEHGLIDSSVVLVTGDHGEAFDEHGNVFHGSSLFNEQVKVPLLTRVGGALPSLRTVFEEHAHTLHSHVDLVPTVLHLFGVPPVFEFEGSTVLSIKPYEIIPYYFLSKQVAVFAPPRKFMYDMEAYQGFEFDLSADPAELVNRWSIPAPTLLSFLESLESRGVVQRR